MREKSKGLCKGNCVKYKAKKPKAGLGRYFAGQVRCQVCDIFLTRDGCHDKYDNPVDENTSGLYCNCCNYKITTRPRSKEYNEKFNQFKKMQSLVEQKIGIGGESGRIKGEDLAKKDIPKIEDVQNEFKEFYQYDENYEYWKNNLKEDVWKAKISETRIQVKKRFCVAIASFGNSKQGGFLYLGVNSQGEIVGLERDKKFAKFADYEDIFANNMRDTLETFLKDRVFILSKLQIKFTEREGKMICVIKISPADEPLWIHDRKNNEEFYVRGSSPRAESLNAKESISYIKERFPNFMEKL